MTATADRVKVRMYNVGFGDCFLLTVTYHDHGQAIDRHVLFDFGTRSHAEDPSITPETTAAQLVEDTCGHLDVLVVTHRHLDHVSAFEYDNTWHLLQGLNPTRIIRPWTDDPSLPGDARGPASPLYDEASIAYATALQAGDALADTLAEMVDPDHGRARSLGYLADGVKSCKAAVGRLEVWGDNGVARYVATGDDCAIGDILPGVTMRILGPPTMDQSKNLKREADTDKREFWMLHQALVDHSAPLVGRGAGGLSPDALGRLAGPDGYGTARWLLERLSDHDIASMMRVVKGFDDALNNTSVVMLVTIGDRNLLFSGDAQIENWSYIISQLPTDPALARALADIDLYKVGHHGSRNATPISIYNLWAQQRTPQKRFVTMLSTLPGVYPTPTQRAKHPDSHTEVPRETLVQHLDLISDLYRTDVPGDVPYIDVEAPARGGVGFTQL